MKRIVQCPKCEAKLSVFDLGKPISQKCPKCGNTFDVMPEGAVETAAAEASPETPPALVAETAEKARPAPVPPSPRQPALAAVAGPEPVVVDSGISFLHVLVMFAMLFLVIVVQVWTFKKTDARLRALEDRLAALASQVQSLSKK